MSASGWLKKKKRGRKLGLTTCYLSLEQIRSNSDLCTINTRIELSLKLDLGFRDYFSYSPLCCRVLEMKVSKKLGHRSFLISFDDVELRLPGTRLWTDLLKKLATLPLQTVDSSHLPSVGKLYPSHNFLPTSYFTLPYLKSLL